MRRPKKGTMDRLLTGKELKVAAQKGLRVRYVLSLFGSNEPYCDEVVVMEKANQGYYIGPSDIDPDEWEDNELATGDFPEGQFFVYSVFGIEYS